MRLRTNMRVLLGMQQASPDERQIALEFTSWLLAVGSGSANIQNDLVQIPDRMFQFYLHCLQF
jgi:hypothetical protein